MVFIASEFVLFFAFIADISVFKLLFIAKVIDFGLVLNSLLK